jgi:glycosyltransferase involved in cell wall biosynthesis
MLTIAIPTFNRNHLLRECVARLLPQLNGHHLLIVDNASDVPVEETLGRWLGEVRATNVRIVRNAANVGGGANILRCLELCESKWLYCLGDDDLVAEDCVRTIERTVKAYEDALYISFSRSVTRRAATFRSEGLEDFISKLDNWSTFLFMSSTIVNAEHMRKELRWGYLYSYSWAPLQAVLLKLLNQGPGQVVFSDAILCNEESLSEETWTPFPVAAGKMVLLELVEDDRLRELFAHKLMSHPSLPSLIYWARVTGNVCGLRANRFFLELYIRRCMHFSSRASLWLYRIVAFFLLRPRWTPTPLFELVEALMFRMMGRSIPTRRPMDSNRT